VKSVTRARSLNYGQMSAPLKCLDMCAGLLQYLPQLPRKTPLTSQVASAMLYIKFFFYKNNKDLKLLSLSTIKLKNIKFESNYFAKLILKVLGLVILFDPDTWDMIIISCPVSKVEVMLCFNKIRIDYFIFNYFFNTKYMLCLANFFNKIILLLHF